MADIDVAVKALVTEAIFKGLDEKKREELIRAAIASLIEPSRDGYGRGGPTQLQEAFNAAAREVAREVVRDRFTKDERFIGEIKKIVGEAVNKIVAEENRHRIVSAMADSLIEAMTPKER